MDIDKIIISKNNAGNKFGYTKQLPQPEYLQVVDFFCGCGGVSAGFKNTRQSHLAFKIIAGIDIDETALLTYEHMIGYVPLELKRT